MALGTACTTLSAGLLAGLPQSAQCQRKIPGLGLRGLGLCSLGNLQQARSLSYPLGPQFPSPAAVHSVLQASPPLPVQLKFWPPPGPKPQGFSPTQGTGPSPARPSQGSRSRKLGPKRAIRFAPSRAGSRCSSSAPARGGDRVGQGRGRATVPFQTHSLLEAGPALGKTEGRTPEAQKPRTRLDWARYVGWTRCARRVEPGGGRRAGL
jgi:hypothetical protein